MINQFCQQSVVPIAAEVDKNDRFPRELWPQMGELGLLGITAEEEYGGSAMKYTENCIVMEELSRASGSIALSYVAHSNLCINQITKFGTHEQKSKYLPPLCSGEHVGGLAMSEPNAGSDVVSMKTTAKLDGDKYILNGTKMWITNASEASTLVSPLFIYTHPLFRLFMPKLMYPPTNMASLHLLWILPLLDSRSPKNWISWV